jgi:hypothetical protein
VVPEIVIGEAWEMFDPDNMVYYLDATNHIAGVEQLAAMPSLVTSPHNPVNSTAWPYSQELAGFYATTSNNTVWGDYANTPSGDTARLQLVPGASIVYPGVWAPNPISTYDTAPPASAQLRLRLPAGFTGTVDWPLVPWDVQGSGTVQLNGVQYAAGSSALSAFLQQAASSPPAIQVIQASGPLAIVYLVNPMCFSVTPSTSVSVRSVDAWALDLQVTAMPTAIRASYSSTASRVRPR